VPQVRSPPAVSSARPTDSLRRLVFRKRICSIPCKEGLLSLVPPFLPLLSRFLRCFTLATMAKGSSTLQLGDRAPEFMLLAANMPQAVSLTHFLQHGPIVVEFLRGTW
jgi:hypothetical protein